MKLFPNAHNNRIFLRCAGCMMAGALVSGVLGTVTPHFRGWQAVGPAVLMLLIAIFVVPYSLHEPPQAR